MTLLPAGRGRRPVAPEDRLPWDDPVDPAAVARVLDGAAPAPFWLDRPERPAAAPPLDGDARADLVVVGAGFTGLWAALQAKEADPAADVVLLEGDRVAEHASGRNGGFCSSSLTHGLAHGLDRSRGELPTLLRLGDETLDAIEAAVARHGIDCCFERTGELAVAVTAWQARDLAALHATAAGMGLEHALLDRDAVQAAVASPRYVAGLADPGCAIVDPARLAWGLAAATRRLGVRLHEGTRVSGLARDGAGVAVRTSSGTVRARRVLLATAAAPGLLAAMRTRVVRVWDYVLVTEPLAADVRASLAWAGRQGVGDSGGRFHYLRLVRDDSGDGRDRLLFGGYDALYGFGGRDPSPAQRSATLGTLAGNLLRTFPQLEGVRATHAWGGVIDTCTRFSPFWGTALGGRVGYVLGFTGLGVGASHFGARVALDLLAGRDTELTRLRSVRRRPTPFPPEPARWVGITATRAATARADARGGRRGPWLRALDAAGLGFDS